MLLLASYMLRYRPLPTYRERRKKESTRSESTHKSLALMSDSKLSLPLSISPKLTPQKGDRSTAATARWSHFLETKPSISNFGYNRPRPHTVLGGATHIQLDATDIAEQDRLTKRAMARRSTDVWLESGHAIQGGSRLSRVGEMLKPVPAMRILDVPVERPQQKKIIQLRGGIVSMLSNRLSDHAPATSESVEHWANFGHGRVPDSPVTIQITSPDKRDVRRASRATVQSMGSEDLEHSGEMEGCSLPSAEIHHATRGRMSAGPTVVLGKQDQGESYEMDWLTAGVLPK
ncbi:hypothetical protein BD324DRAFT_527089 [Kockovaella imperatae]|uniref:Uncharacterized protein n=1 Tax=Kockovaella imperatae TaxID=4999 RepID=A0A1Y1UDK8_9TREE|nr:hypothetical protein BD324DRAFT_527089 [Kockovaella imperatae]ORX36148.1 hypothetical protein BD324DRAFT_527089 [Kockovaella imperatae]